MKYTEDQLITAAQNMMDFGGSFMQCIGQALLRADANNTEKIVSLWSDDVDKYLNF